MTGCINKIGQLEDIALQAVSDKVGPLEDSVTGCINKVGQLEDSVTGCINKVGPLEDIALQAVSTRLDH